MSEAHTQTVVSAKSSSATSVLQLLRFKGRFSGRPKPRPAGSSASVSLPLFQKKKLLEESGTQLLF